MPVVEFPQSNARRVRRHHRPSMSKMGTLPESGSREEMIFESAANLFYTKGYHATTVSDIARSAGLVKGSIYHYIRSKDDLLYAIILGSQAQCMKLVDEAISHSTDPVERIQLALNAHIKHMAAHPAHVGTFLSELNTLSGTRREKIGAMMKEYQDSYVRLIREGQAAGKLKNGDPLLMVYGLLGMCNWIYRWYHGKHVPNLELIQQTFLGIVSSGILVGPQTDSPVTPGAAFQEHEQLAVKPGEIPADNFVNKMFEDPEFKRIFPQKARNLIDREM